MMPLSSVISVSVFFLLLFVTQADYNMCTVPRFCAEQKSRQEIRVKEDTLREVLRSLGNCRVLEPSGRQSEFPQQQSSHGFKLVSRFTWISNSKLLPSNQSSRKHPACLIIVSMPDVPCTEPVCVGHIPQSLFW